MIFLWKRRSPRDDRSIRKWKDNTFALPELLERPTHGQIIVNNKVIFDADDNKSLGDAQIRKNRLHFGMVFQSFNLFPQYTALRNCTLARELMAKERPDFKENKKKIMDEITAEEKHSLRVLA